MDAVAYALAKGLKMTVEAWASKADQPTIGGSTNTVIANGVEQGTDIYYIFSDRQYYKYDTLTETWAAKATAPTDFNTVHGAAPLNGKNYHLGVYGSGQSYSYVYDPASNAWTKLANMPLVGVSQGMVLPIGNKLYHFNGYQSSAPRNYLQVFDPAANTWERKADSVYSRYLTAGGVIGGKGYIVGGFNASTPTNIAEEYDPGTDTYRVIAAYPLSCYYMNGAAMSIPGLGERLHVMAGSLGAGGDTPGHYQYDVTANKWFQMENVPGIARRQACVNVVGNKFYVALGWRSSPGQLDKTVRTYTPAQLNLSTLLGWLAAN